MITFNNFMYSTQGIFKGCNIPKRAPDYVSSSGSKYWYGENSKGQYIIRLSDHWVKIRNTRNNKVYIDSNGIVSCQWHLKTNKTKKRYKSGKIYLTELRPLM